MLRAHQLWRGLLGGCHFVTMNRLYQDGDRMSIYCLSTANHAMLRASYRIGGGLGVETAWWTEAPTVEETMIITTDDVIIKAISVRPFTWNTTCPACGLDSTGWMIFIKRWFYGRCHPNLTVSFCQGGKEPTEDVEDHNPTALILGPEGPVFGGPKPDTAQVRRYSRTTPTCQV